MCCKCEHAEALLSKQMVMEQGRVEAAGKGDYMLGLERETSKGVGMPGKLADSLDLLHLCGDPCQGPN